MPSNKNTRIKATMGNASSEQREGDSPPAAALEGAQGNSTADDQGTNMSYWQMAKVGYNELVNAVIRPPRADYSVEDLGPAYFKFMGRNFQRTDFRLCNERGMSFKIS